MPCSPFRGPNGSHGIICTRSRQRRKRCQVPGCASWADYQCDGEVEGGTCNAYVCNLHRAKVGADRDLCPTCEANQGGRPAPGRVWDILIPRQIDGVEVPVRVQVHVRRPDGLVDRAPKILSWARNQPWDAVKARLRELGYTGRPAEQVSAEG